MSPEREKYLQSISFGERVCRHCFNRFKDKLKREKRYLTEHKVKSLGEGFDVARCKKSIKFYKKKLTFFRHELRIGTNHC